MPYGKRQGKFNNGKEQLPQGQINERTLVRFRCESATFAVESAIAPILVRYDAAPESPGMMVVTPPILAACPPVQSDGYAIWHGAVSRAVCSATVGAIERAAPSDGRVLRHGREQHDAAMRACTEHALAATDAAAVTQAMRAVGAAALTAAGGARARFDGPLFCRYRQGGHFRAHRDRSPDPFDAPAVRSRGISLVCLLNDGDDTHGAPAFDGGALVLYPEFVPVNAPLRAGSIIAFASDLLHEVRPVRLGTRYSAVAWLYDVLTREESPHAEPA